MIEPAKKKPVLDTMKVTAEMAQEVKIEAARQGRFIYEVAADSWALYRASTGSLLTPEHTALLAAFAALLKSGDKRNLAQILPTIREYLPKLDAPKLAPGKRGAA